MKPTPPIHGLLAEFNDPTELIAAVKRTRDAGYEHVDAYTPYPIHELSEAMGLRRDVLPLIALIGGITGLMLGFALQYYTTVIDYPMNIGGKPLFSWPAYFPVCFELTVLLAALSTVVGMIGLNGLPLPYHPVFNVPRFALASRDRFYLCIEASDPKFDRDETRRFLERSTPRFVSEIDH